MTKAAFWKKDWFLGLVMSLALLAAGGTQLIEGLERFAYDWGVRASARTPSDRISVIAIDKRSIDNIGRWPWSREVHAKMIESLASARPKVIGYTVFFSEPQVDPGLAYVNRLLETYRRLVPANADPGAPPRGVAPELVQIGATPSANRAANPTSLSPNSCARTRSRSKAAAATCRFLPAQSKSPSWKAWARPPRRWDT